MNSMRKAFALVLAPVGLTIALAAPAQAVTPSQTTTIVHATAATLPDCATGKPDTPGPTIGSAKFKETATTVTVTFSVTGLQPKTLYELELIQTPSGENCGIPEKTFRTDSRGRAHVSYSEPRQPGQTGAFLVINTPGFSDSAASREVTF